MTRWATFVYRFPWLVTAVAITIAVAGAALAVNIKVKGSFSALLPDNSQAVKDLGPMDKRLGGMGTLVVNVEGKNLKAMERFADDLAAKLRAYPKSEVLFVDDKIDVQKAFFDHNKFLYLSVEELTRVRDRVRDEIARQKAKANPFFVDLDDEPKAEGGKKEKAFDFAKEKEKYEKHLKRFDKYKDGYLTTEDGSALVLIVKTVGSATGVAFAQHFAGKVEDEVARLDPKRYHPSLQVTLTGELKDIPAEYEALRSDIVIVSNLCVLVVLLSVSLYYRSVRMTIILSIALLGGIGTTFGIVYLHIGYLTAATAFLAAIVAGNGINFGIYFLARYLEERQEHDVQVALTRSLAGTVVSVSTAAFASGTSYASLMLTQFKGFNQFGFIGGVGMVTCLVFALTLAPALTVLMERHFPFKRLSKERFERGRIFSRGAAFVVERMPRTVLVAGVLATVGSAVLLAFFLRDPYEYDFRKLRNQFVDKTGSRSGLADKILGERSSPHVILADNIGQVPKIEKALERFTADNPDPEKRVVKNVKTIFDYLPGTVDEQKRKLPLLAEIRDLILNNDFKKLSAEDQRQVRELTPPADLAVVTMNSLPEEFVRPFVELDGTRGTVVYVDMKGSVWNGESLRRFAKAVRSIKLDDGKIVRSSGKTIIFADMLEYVATEGPRATATAFALVLVVIVIAYRNAKRAAIVAVSMVSGVLLMMGAAVVLKQKINFLNFIAIPIQFGIGVDYVANLYSRFMQEGRGSIGRVLRSTGGAVMISSLTTIIGYGAMWFSVNGAVNTFGTMANMGEFTMLAVAVLFLPAYLALFRGGLERHGRRT
ncbi:MAG: MMPL family transporter [Deltaproteobacteria bacterium]|nr:MMPL family transporter [Deltaproteobacteria bacterium]